MRFRKPLPSNFETVFSDLFSAADAPGEILRPSNPISIDSLEAAWGVAAQAREPIRSANATPEARRLAYGDDSDGDGASAHNISLDPHKILSELGLHGSATDAEISVLRREFALRNHPDRVPSELRELATHRMMIANDLIDRFLASRRRSTR